MIWNRKGVLKVGSLIVRYGEEVPTDKLDPAVLKKLKAEKAIVDPPKPKKAKKGNK